MILINLIIPVWCINLTLFDAIGVTLTAVGIIGVLLYVDIIGALLYVDVVVDVVVIGSTERLGREGETLQGVRGRETGQHEHGDHPDDARSERAEG